MLALAPPSNSNKAYACEVLSPPSVEEAYDNSAAVFSGRTVEVQNFTVEDFGDWRLVSFEVDRYWKIPNENDYRQLIIFTAIDSGACGYDFEVGKAYLVYAASWWHDRSSLYTSIGMRTQPIESAQEDLAFLGKGKAPTKELSWDEQINRIMIQPLPTGQEEQAKSTILSVVGIGAAIAGGVAFLSLRRIKGKK